MRIGIFGGEPASIDAAVDGAREAAEQGFSGYWVSQIFGFDALTVLAVVGREVPDIELGTGVVPTYPRHPMMLAQQALTVQLATGGRLMLGIGLSHKVVIENMFGLSFEKPGAPHARVPLDPHAAPPDRLGRLHGRDAQRERYHQHSGRHAVPGARRRTRPEDARARGHPRRRHRDVDDRAGDPRLAHGADDHEGRGRGRSPEPAHRGGHAGLRHRRPRRGRARAAQIFQVYGVLPSYRAMLDREGAPGPEDLAIIGTEAEVKSEIQRLADAGVTDFVAAEFGAGADEKRRTRELLRSLL